VPKPRTWRATRQIQREKSRFEGNGGLEFKRESHVQEQLSQHATSIDSNIKQKCVAFGQACTACTLAH
jgi:hypothetical protein